MRSASIVSPALKYGLLGAFATALWLLLAWVLGLHTRHIALGHYFNYGAEVFFAIALWGALRAHLVDRNYYWLPVWRGLAYGLYTSLVTAMGIYIFLSLYLNFIHPEYPDLYLDWRVASMRAAGEPEEQIRNMARAYRWSTSANGLPITIAMMYLLFGLIASPIFTLWLNWRRKETAR